MYFLSTPQIFKTRVEKKSQQNIVTLQKPTEPQKGVSSTLCPRFCITEPQNGFFLAAKRGQNFR